MLKDTIKKLTGMGIARKFIIWTVAIIILFNAFTAFLILNDLKKDLSFELNERGEDLSSNLAEESLQYLSKNDTINLRYHMRDIKKIESDVKYVYITDADGNLMINSFSSGIKEDFQIATDTRINKPESIIDFKAPILNGSKGFVHLGMDKTLMNSKINLTTNLLAANIIIEGILGFLMAYIAVFHLTRPIRSLLKGVEEITRGNTSIKIATDLNDHEMNTLSNAFNRMADDLNKSISELRKSEEKYRGIIEMSIDIIYLSDREGNQIFMNDAGYRALEAGHEEVIGKPWIIWIHPDDREKTFKKFNDMIEKKIDVFGFENRYVSKSGKVINVLHNVTILRNEKGDIVGTQGIARDITQRKETMEKLMQLSTAVEEAPDGIQIIDLEGRVIYSNKAIEQIYGFSPDELKEKHVNDMNVDPEFASKVILPSLQNSGHWVGELSVKHKSGRAFPIQLNSSVVKDNQGRPIAMVGIIRDISDLKEKEMLEKQLLQADKLATIGQLAAGVAHEINNPLGNISLYTQMLLNKANDDESKSKLVVINDEANRAAHIVKGLLDFARQSELSLNQININEEIEKILNILQPQLKEIKVTKDFGKIPLIIADSSQIQQVLMNLLTNSIQSITENGEIFVTTLSKNDHIEISITDNGCGIPGENLHKIFDPFFTTKEQGEGTGLGLSISYGIIKRHNGSIEVKSEVGKGSTFIIKLPK